MGKIEATEGETLEFKRQWTERALEDLAAFANMEGGRLLIGIRDDGEIVGARTDDRELQRIANLIAAHLGITPSLRMVEIQGLPVKEKGEQRSMYWGILAINWRFPGDFGDYLEFPTRAQKGLKKGSKGSQTRQRGNNRPEGGKA